MMSWTQSSVILMFTKWKISMTNTWLHLVYQKKMVCFLYHNSSKQDFFKIILDSNRKQTCIRNCQIINMFCEEDTELKRRINIVPENLSKNWNSLWKCCGWCNWKQNAAILLVWWNNKSSFKDGEPWRTWKNSNQSKYQDSPWTYSGRRISNRSKRINLCQSKI